MTVHGQVSDDQADAPADRQNLDVLRAIFTALDEAGGRSWRTLHPDAPTAILQLAKDAERRGAVKALELLHANAVKHGGKLNPVALSSLGLKQLIEAGEVPL